MAREVFFFLQGVQAGYTNEPLFTDVDLFLHAGDCYTLVGRNGTGKSSLFNVIDGSLELEEGKRFTLEPLVIGRLNQSPIKPISGTALDFAMSQGEMEVYRAEAMLYELDINPTMNATTMSGGQIRRCGLAGALAQDPDVLLLDEPTNHLDLPAVEWLEKEIKRFRGAIVVISHDRRFLSNVSNGMMWLEDKKLRFINRSFAFFDEWQDSVYEEAQKKFTKLQQHIKQEERYALRGVTARRKRNQHRLERLQSLRMERMERKNPATASLIAAETKASSKLVFEAKHMSKSYGEKIICEDFSFRVLRGDTIGIVGGNGTGKSTLLKMLLKTEEIDSGSVRMAKQLDIAYFDQYREQLDPKQTPWELLGNGGDHVRVGKKEIHVVGYLKRFLFDHEDARAKISTLSGGQKNRLLLAKILAEPTDVMILDEPTNDLDMDTLDVLEDMLSDYKGTLIIVSHDRDFLDRLCSCMLILEGQGKVVEIIGGWDDYLRQKEEEKVPKEKCKLSKPAPLPSIENGKNKSNKPKKEKKIKLTPKEQHAIKTIPAEIEKLQTTIKKMNELLADPKLYINSPDTFAEVSTALATSEETLAILENKWLDLSIKAEEIEGQ